MDFHFMQNNFSSWFCCRFEITDVEKAGKESCQNRISESVWLNGFRNQFDYYFARSQKRTEDVQFVELLRAEKNAKVNPCI